MGELTSEERGPADGGRLLLLLLLGRVVVLLRSVWVWQEVGDVHQRYPSLEVSGP